jgi:hypothetical protein
VEAAQGKRAEAFRDLQKAIDHGYSDAEEIAHEASWKAFRDDANYQQALALIKNRSTSR